MFVARAKLQIQGKQELVTITKFLFNIHRIDLYVVQMQRGHISHMLWRKPAAVEK